MPNDYQGGPRRMTPEELAEFGQLKTSKPKEETPIPPDLSKFIQDEAGKYAKNHSVAPDKQFPDWIMSDFKAGANLLLPIVQQLREENERLKEESDLLAIKIKGWRDENEELKKWYNKLDSVLKEVVDYAMKISTDKKRGSVNPKQK